ncbi:hypothetical protein ACFYXF_23210 [Streptomyces sp. NPDC002680]|uniref:hypothetical protein n=1 Tax=Streptomyces sp. NPDC002680 TaxID=3364659 RepID=UPI003697D2AC
MGTAGSSAEVSAVSSGVRLGASDSSVGASTGALGSVVVPGSDGCGPGTTRSEFMGSVSASWGKIDPDEYAEPPAAACRRATDHWDELVGAREGGVSSIG